MIDSLKLQHQNQYSNLVNEILQNKKFESSKAIQIRMNEYAKWKFNFVKLKMKKWKKHKKSKKWNFCLSKTCMSTIWWWNTLKSVQVKVNIW